MRSFYLRENIVITGMTGCGKSLLLQFLLEQALAHGTKVVGVDRSFLGKASELALWAAQHRDQRRGILKVEAPLIFDLKPDLDDRGYSRELAIVLLRQLDTLIQRDCSDKYIFCVDNAEQFVECSAGTEVIQRISNNKNTQLILTLQPSKSLALPILKDFPTWLIGRISLSDMYCLQHALNYEEKTLRQCIDFPDPRSNKGSSTWLVTQNVQDPKSMSFKQFNQKQIVELAILNLLSGFELDSLN